LAQVHSLQESNWIQITRRLEGRWKAKGRKTDWRSQSCRPRDHGLCTVWQWKSLHLTAPQFPL